MFSPHQSKIDWIRDQWHDLPPHVQETITLLVDKCVVDPYDAFADEALAQRKFTRSSNNRRIYGLSRWLLKVLRHHPEAAGASMDRNGWVLFENIAQSLPAHLADFSDLPTDYLVELVGFVLWQRVQFDGNRLRATYGHTTRSSSS